MTSSAIIGVGIPGPMSDYHSIVGRHHVRAISRVPAESSHVTDYSVRHTVSHRIQSHLSGGVSLVL